MSEAVERFKTALADIPEVQNRLTAGQQFNAYDLARSKPYTNTVGIGPVFNLLSLADTMAPEAAELIEAALRLSVASLTGEGEPVAQDAKDAEITRLRADITALEDGNMTWMCDQLDKAKAENAAQAVELERMREALGMIAEGSAPPDPHGHYLAHRRAVDAARQALKAG